MRQRRFHAAVHGFLFGTGDVRAVAVAGEADDFGINLCTARAGVFQGFKHHHARAFADDEAVAGAVIGGGRGLRRIVFQAGGIERVENADFRMAEFFAAACEHHRDLPVADGFVGVANGLATRGAGAGGRNQPPFQAEEDGEVGCGRVRHHADVCVGGEAFGMAVHD